MVTVVLLILTVVLVLLVRLIVMTMATMTPAMVIDSDNDRNNVHDGDTDALLNLVALLFVVLRQRHSDCSCCYDYLCRPHLAPT